MPSLANPGFVFEPELDFGVAVTADDPLHSSRRPFWKRRPSQRKKRQIGVTLKYALLCATCSLRIRERVPRALVARPSEAQHLPADIEAIADHIERPP